jgi:hypothetical protein
MANKNTGTTKATATFPDWMAKVDRLIGHVCGASADDLSDCCYADWYDSGMSAGTAARKAIKNAGGEI